VSADITDEEWRATFERLNEQQPEGVTCARLAAALKRSPALVRNRLEADIRAGICECVGLRPVLDRSTRIPVYRLKEES